MLSLNITYHISLIFYRTHTVRGAKKWSYWNVSFFSNLEINGINLDRRQGSPRSATDIATDVKNRKLILKIVSFSFFCVIHEIRVGSKYLGTVKDQFICVDHVRVQDREWKSYCILCHSRPQQQYKRTEPPLVDRMSTKKTFHPSTLKDIVWFSSDCMWHFSDAIIWSFRYAGEYDH